MTNNHPRAIRRVSAQIAAGLTAVALLAPVATVRAAAAPASVPRAVAAAQGLTATGYGLVDPAQGLWYLRNSAGDTATFFYGNPGDVPMTGDWDCDGDETPGMYRQSDGFVYLRNSNTAGIGDTRFFFGNPDDVPLAGDFDGDGCDTVSLYRPTEQRFYVINELGQDEGGLGAADFSFLFGNPDDKPVVGDWDGDGVDEIGLHRETTGFFYFRDVLSTGIATGQFFFGDPNDRFVAGDWGRVDGVDTPGVFRPSDSRFYLRYTNTQGNADEARTMGDGTWLPVAGNFGTLKSRVTVTLTNAPAGLASAVSGLYSWNSAAWGIPAGLRSHLQSLGTLPPPGSLAGQARTATVLGQLVAVAVISSDVVLAVKHSTGWKVVGAKLASRGVRAWYGGVRHVLVLGGDQPASDAILIDNNADSVHVLAADAAIGQGAVVGLPRDTFVTAPYGLDKLAITMRDKGTGQPFGPGTTLTSVRTLTGLPIEGYLLTGFPGFINIVDGFGGFSANLFQKIPMVGGPGVVKLNGGLALRVARERQTLPNGDVDRSLNQGTLVLAALGKVKGMGILAVPSLLDLLDNHAVSDLNAERLLTLGATAFEMGAVPNVVVEGDVTAKTIRGAAAFGFELDASNATVWPDLADGALSSGRCATATSKPAADTPCWRRPG